MFLYEAEYFKSVASLKFAIAAWCNIFVLLSNILIYICICFNKKNVEPYYRYLMPDYDPGFTKVKNVSLDSAEHRALAVRHSLIIRYNYSQVATNGFFSKRVIEGNVMDVVISVIANLPIHVSPFPLRCREKNIDTKIIPTYFHPPFSPYNFQINKFPKIQYFRYPVRSNLMKENKQCL